MSTTTPTERPLPVVPVDAVLASVGVKAVTDTTLDVALYDKFGNQILEEGNGRWSGLSVLASASGSTLIGLLTAQFEAPEGAVGAVVRNSGSGEVWFDLTGGEAAPDGSLGTLDAGGVCALGSVPDSVLALLGLLYGTGSSSGGSTLPPTDPISLDISHLAPAQSTGWVLNDNYGSLTFGLDYVQSEAPAVSMTFTVEVSMDGITSKGAPYQWSETNNRDRTGSFPVSVGITPASALVALIQGWKYWRFTCLTSSSGSYSAGSTGSKALAMTYTMSQGAFTFPAPFFSVTYGDAMSITNPPMSTSALAAVGGSSNDLLARVLMGINVLEVNIDITIGTPSALFGAQSGSKIAIVGWDLGMDVAGSILFKEGSTVKGRTGYRSAGGAHHKENFGRGFVGSTNTAMTVDVDKLVEADTTAKLRGSIFWAKIA